jgi:hypothetical protein
MKILIVVQIDYRVRIMIREFYKHQTILIKIKESERKATIRNGVRQGCNISPLLFNIHTEQIVNECKEYCTGINLYGMKIQMPRFADDVVIIAQDKINLKRALESLGDILKSKFKMKINRIKIEVVVC